MTRIAPSLLITLICLLPLAGCSSSRRPEGSSPPAAATRPGMGDDPELLRALELVEGQRYGEAVRLLEDLRSRPPVPAEVYSLLGLAHLQLEDFEAAERVLREGRNRHPRDDSVAKSFARLLFVRGRRALEDGAGGEARDLFVRAVAEAPPDSGMAAEVAALYRLRAYAMVEVGRPADALGLVEDAAALGLAGDALTVVRAAALDGVGRRSEALRELYSVEPDRLADPDVKALYEHLGGRPEGRARAPRDGLVRTAEDLLQRGRPDEALAAVDRALRGLAPDAPRRGAYLELAFRAAFAAKDYPRARQLVEQRMRLDPGDLDAQLDLGRLLAVMGDAAGAREHYETLLARRPGEPRVRLAHAAFLVTAGDVGAAETHLLSLANSEGLGPRVEGRVYELLGICCTRKNDLACAESWWQRKVGLDPGDAKTYYNLGFLYQKRRRYREAVENFEKAVEAANEKDPNFVKYLYWLGLAYRQNGQTRDMSRTFRKIVVVAPYQDPYRQKVIPMMEREGEGLRRRPEGVPEDRGDPLRLAWERLETGDLRAARESFRQVLEGEEGDRTRRRLAHHGLGLVARRSNEPAAAVVHFEAAVDAGRDTRARRELAETYFDLGLYERSLESWRRLRRTEELAPARRRYEEARCLDRLGRLEEAMEAYEEALSLDPDSLFAGSARVRLEELVPSFLDPQGASGPVPSPGPGLAQVAAAYLEEGDQGRAERLFSEALESDPDNAVALVGFGRLRLERGDGAAAEDAFRRAVAADPEGGAGRVELARLVLDDPQRLQEGFSLLAEARERGGDAGVEATLEMVRLYREVGQEEDARFLLEELERSPEVSPEVRRRVRAELAERGDAPLAEGPPTGGRGPGE